MGCEISRIEASFKKKSHAQAFATVYNKVMSEREDWFKDEHLLSESLLEEKDGKYLFEVDAYGMFEDPYETALRYVIREYVLQYSDAEFHMWYDISWDNSYENWIEVYHYEDGVLTINFQDNFDSDEDDYDEDDEDDFDFFDDEDEYSSEIYKYSVCEGALQLIEGNEDVFEEDVDCE